MKLFSNRKDPKRFNLKASDFKTESTNAAVTSAWYSPEFLKMLPKQPTNIEKNASNISRTSIATIELFAKQVEVIFDPDDIKGNLDKFIELINQRLNWILINKTSIDETIVRDLLNLKNSNWLSTLGTKELPFSKMEFLNQITLTSVDFWDDGGFELCFNDGNIFGGHWIVVSITSDNKIEEATLEG